MKKKKGLVGRKFPRFFLEPVKREASGGQKGRQKKVFTPKRKKRGGGKKH